MRLFGMTERGAALIGTITRSADLCPDRCCGVNGARAPSSRRTARPPTPTARQLVAPLQGARIPPTLDVRAASRVVPRPAGYRAERHTDTERPGAFIAYSTRPHHCQLPSVAGSAADIDQAAPELSRGSRVTIHVNAIATARKKGRKSRMPPPLLARDAGPGRESSASTAARSLAVAKAPRSGGLTAARSLAVAKAPCGGGLTTGRSFAVAMAPRSGGLTTACSLARREQGRGDGAAPVRSGGRSLT
ncbi:unnamed protein product [Lampetra planeri]